MNEKKEANKKAKNARRLLKKEKKDFSYSKKINNNKLNNINKDKEKDQKIIEKEKKQKLYQDSQEKKLNQKREKIIATNNKKALQKFDKKIEIKRNKDKIKKINKLNNNPKGIKNIKNSSKDIIIEVKNVTKTYTTKTLFFNALDNVSLEIKKGEFIVILGPSGSGKSTLLNVISGLDRPTNGEIIIDNVNIASLKDKELTNLRRDKIGFVFQSYNLLPTLNVSDNVEIGRNLQTDKKKRMNINNILNDMNMFNQSKKRVYELSGGQQQRVSIARAISKSPDILIGDEPTGALDTKSRSDVFSIFQKLNKDLKTTIIIVTHNPQIAKLANKIIEVKDGKIYKVTTNKKTISADQLGKHYE